MAVFMSIFSWSVGCMRQPLKDAIGKNENYPSMCVCVSPLEQSWLTYSNRVMELGFHSFYYNLV
jgi:hypothetical protein